MPRFVDNSVLCNFAAVDALDLLAEFLGEQGHWARSVESETLASLSHIPGLKRIVDEQWFPPSVPANQDGEAARVDRFRRIQMYGDPMKPKEHLGESETFVLISRDEFRGSVFLTDDSEAFRVMKAMGVQTIDTVDVLKALVARGSLSSQEAFDLVLRMEDARRELRQLPKSARDFE